MRCYTQELPQGAIIVPSLDKRLLPLPVALPFLRIPSNAKHATRTQLLPKKSSGAARVVCGTGTRTQIDQLVLSLSESSPLVNGYQPHTHTRGLALGCVPKLTFEPGDAAIVLGAPRRG